MRSALVLNATFEPLSIVPARRAICLVLSDKAEIVEEDDLVRVRILESLPEAIINASGEEVNLEAGDVHFLDSITAEMLVDGGFAKIAAL